MKRALILLLLLSTLHASDFLTERVDVTVSDIRSDGSAKVHESIKFVMYGDSANSLYDSSISDSSLTVWSTNTGLKDVKMHVNSALVDVRDFRLRPQPRTKCNPIQGICHGELILDYWAYPSHNNTSELPISGTGLFTVEQYKPRTKIYTLNPEALSFTTTNDGNIILGDVVYFTVNMPDESRLIDVNPLPTDKELQLPTHVDKLSWNDIVLVKFSFVFDVEEGIDKEISDFFASIIKGIADLLSGPEGFAIIVLMLILIGSYFYIIMAKRRGEE